MLVGTVLAVTPKPPAQPSWGRFIQERREARGLTIRQAALLADVSDSYWGQVERGHQVSRGAVRVITPSRPMLIAIAETLRLTTKDTNRLLAMAEFPPVQDADRGTVDRAALVDLSRLSRRDVALLNAIADRLREAPVAGDGPERLPLRAVARRTRGKPQR